MGAGNKGEGPPGPIFDARPVISYAVNRPIIFVNREARQAAMKILSPVSDGDKTLYIHPYL